MKLPSFNDLLRRTEVQDSNISAAPLSDVQQQVINQEIARLLDLLQKVKAERLIEQQQINQIKSHHIQLANHATQLTERIQQLEKELEESTRDFELKLNQKENLLNEQKQALIQKQRDLTSTNQLFQELRQSIFSSDLNAKEISKKYADLGTFCQQLQSRIRELESQLEDSRQTNQALVSSMHTTFQEKSASQWNLNQTNQMLAEAQEQGYLQQRTISQLQETIENLQKENQNLKSKLENVGKIRSTVNDLLDTIKENE
jgi:chromosome segregation ATPase